MFRRLLIALLLAATVLGPQWCCCRLRCWLADATQAAAQATSAVRTSCCSRGQTNGTGKQTPAKDHCPCQQRARDFAQSSDASESVQDLLRAAERVYEFLDFDAALARDLVEPGILPGLRPVSGTAINGGRDLLRTYQVLRC